MPTPIPINFSVPMAAGDTVAFYVTLQTGFGIVNYTNGTAVGNVYAQDANIQQHEGYGGVYFGLAFSPRVWNGKIYYESGCVSATRTSCTGTVTTADSIVVTASQTSICGLPASATVTLNASSASTTYTYSWVGADLNSTTGPSVTATPNATTTYIVTGDDGVCADTAAITITLHLPPPALATVVPPSLCLLDSAQLNTPLANFQIGNGTLTNTTTSYPSPFGNFWTGDRNQNLILASELLAVGMNAGPINSARHVYQLHRFRWHNSAYIAHHNFCYGLNAGLLCCINTAGGWMDYPQFFHPIYLGRCIQLSHSNHVHAMCYLSVNFVC
jgi:hypothetical protein